jgi:hypothetical protein
MTRAAALTTSTETADAVVVGAGHNGLVAANLLADQGWSVTVLEAADAPGGATRTEEITAPGFVHDVMATTFVLFITSPAYAALAADLGRHGLEFCNTKAPTGVLRPDGTHLIQRMDRQANIAAFAQSSDAGDGAQYAADVGDIEKNAGLLFGLLGAVVLIYLLIVVNFQSWSDPFVIITALPAALAGIVWMLFTTQTTLSVPALTGAIMCMGVATANSVLVISFARERYAELGDPIAAAIEAGFVRFRPVLMTALAMIIGMAPMAFGLGEGGEQNAPLGRAVIGGLIFATIATLMFVPVVFSMVHKKQDATAAASETSHAH